MTTYLVEEEENVFTVFDNLVEAKQYCDENDLDYEYIETLQNGDTIQVNVTITSYRVVSKVES